MISAVTAPSQTSGAVPQLQTLGPCRAEPVLSPPGIMAQLRPCACLCLQKEPAASFSRDPILLLVLLNEDAVVRDYMRLHRCVTQPEYNHPNSPFLIWICSNSYLEGHSSQTTE